MHGFIGLHGVLILLLLCATFMGSVLFFRATGLVVLNEDLNFRLYLVGVLVASVSMTRHMRGAAGRYGMYTIGETLRLTTNQMMRLMLAMFAIVFATKDTTVSRAFLGFFLGVSSVALVAANFILPKLLAFLFERESVYRSVIVAQGPVALRLRSWLANSAQIGEKLHGYIAESPCAGDHGLEWLGRPADLLRLVREHAIDQILVDQTLAGTASDQRLVEACELAGVRVRYFVDIHALLPATVSGVEQAGGYTFANSSPEPLDNPACRLCKRLLDVAIALPVVLFVLPPLVLVTALVQAVQSPGPVLYSQWRSGFNRRRFRIYKLRTMRVAGNEDHARQATRGDARVYPFGRFLRSSSLDELPQFLNVLIGDMSVSGPRPHLLEHDELFAQRVRTYRKRHLVKPGITGLAQMKGYRGEVTQSSDIFRRVRYDMLYISKWSLGMDLRIIASTIKQVLFPPSKAV